MLHYGHQLDSIVALFLNPWKNMIREVVITRDFPFPRCDADVGFVDTERSETLRPRMPKLVLLLGRGIPEQTLEEEGVHVLVRVEATRKNPLHG